MPKEALKPLKWTPDPSVGFSVARRPDGGMHVTFTNVSHDTLVSWRRFALDHLLDSDRLTRNLYDLRQIDQLPDEAIRVALEVSSDPAARHIRLAVVVGTETVKEAVERIVAMATPATARIQIFTDMDKAENWLSRPLNTMI